MKVYKVTAIKSLDNYSGRLYVKEDDGCFYWCLDTWSFYHWSQIPESLYKEIVEFNDSVEQAEKQQ